MNRKESNVTNVEDLEELINRIQKNLNEILPKPSAPANNSPSKVFLIKLRELHDDVDALKEVIESLDNIGLKLGVTIDDNSIDLE